MRANVWKELENYFLILLGTALMAIAIQWIFDRVGLITGGFTGLTIIIRNLTEALLDVYKRQLPYRIHQAHLPQDQRLQVMQDSL